MLLLHFTWSTWSLKSSSLTWTSSTGGHGWHGGRWCHVVKQMYYFLRMKRSIICFKHFQVIHHTAYMHKYKLSHIQCICNVYVWYVSSFDLRWRCPTKLRGWRRWLAMCRPCLVAFYRWKTLVEPLFDTNEILKIKWESFYWCRFWLQRSRFGSSGSSDIWRIFFFLACSPILSHRLSVARLTWRSNGFSKALIFRCNDVAFGVPGPCPTSMASRQLWHWLWVSASQQLQSEGESICENTFISNSSWSWVIWMSFDVCPLDLYDSTLMVWLDFRIRLCNSIFHCCCRCSPRNAFGCHDVAQRLGVRNRSFKSRMNCFELHPPVIWGIDF